MRRNLERASLTNGTVSAEIEPPPEFTSTKTVARVVPAVLTEEIGYIRNQVRDLHEVAGDLHKQSHYAEWNDRTNKRSRVSTKELLDEIGDLGFAWRDVARIVGVSVPAIQKWRRGEGATGGNRQKVASLLAACDLVTEDYGIHEVASWFEKPIQLGIPVTPIDLWVGQRSDLIFDFASGHTDSEQILAAWDPQWRERYDSDFEVFEASDGNLSIRPKER